MRKVSAHYYLKPGGTFGKHPIIVLNDDGRIENIREQKEGFREEAGLAYYPGIIIPGFVASIDRQSENADVERIALVNGVLRIKRGIKSLSTEEYINPWTSICNLVNEQAGFTNLSHYLMKHTAKAAHIAGEAEWGVIGDGAKPGLLVIQNIDLRDFSLTAKTALKIIQR